MNDRQLIEDLLSALEDRVSLNKWQKARDAVREALAEQSAQSTADKSELETVPAKGGLLPTQQAERLADGLERDRWITHGPQWCYDAAAELRRLVSFNQQLMDEVARLQKREWVGLTDNEIALIHADYPHPQGFARAVEAKLKEKNHA